jgi:asparagine synthase (glutamine-hydrolysing)
MSNEDATVWITFNGEIYNFQELRAELEARGHVFKTMSDTEVIVHAYEEYGRQCLDRFRGMFAFAIWDSRTHTLFLARDRVGKKPLYYFVDKDRLLFASEIKAILADPAVPRDPDPVAIDHFLALQYIPSPLSAFRGLYKLPPAHWLEVHDGGRIETGRYWKLHYSPKQTLSWQDAIAELRWRIAEAVRMRLVSDVPLGAFLSGGVDSSAVVASMAGEMDRPVRTFSIGFAEASFDERPFARQVAERYRTAHTELVVDTQVKDILPQLAWYYDEPLGDASAVPSYAIAGLTRQHVTVVLNGDGGDENFAGYGWYLMDRFAHRGEIVPLALRRNFHALMQGLPERWRQYAPLRKAARLAEVLALPPAYRYAQWVSHFGPELRYNLYASDFKSMVNGSCPEASFERVFAQSDADDWTDTILDADVQLYLPDDLLVKIDRATMAHSLEARSPLLDHELMEFVASLPAEFKLSGTRKKHILKAALRGVVPDAVLDRPKMGFSAPIAQWLRHDLREMVYDVLLSPRTLQRGYFEPRVISTLLHQHDSGNGDHAAKLWDLLMLELWHREFIDRSTFVFPKEIALARDGS